MEADLETVLCSGLEGLVLPKVESVEEVKMVEKVLDTRESEVGLEPGIAESFNDILSVLPDTMINKVS